MQSTKRFVIERPLGSGGMGQVYLAYDRERNMRVAVKTMRQMDPASLYRFKREFRALAEIAHHNVVALYELIATDEQWLLTMEPVDGVDFLSYVRDSSDIDAVSSSASGPLSAPGSDAIPATATRSLPGDQVALEGDISAQRAALPSHGALPPMPDITRLRAALAQLIDGVCALHEHGCLHMDLKPSNVLVTSAGRVVILDFGVATELRGARSRDPSAAGTPAYMAPEIATSNGGAASPASDWYSVGVMLYEALAGSRPFQGEPGAIVRAKQTMEPPPPSTYRPDAPADLDELCAALLRRHPDERPSATEIARRLHKSPRRRGGAGELFMGRQRQLAALRGALDDAESGRGRIALVHGRSGMGKSSLLGRLRGEIDERAVVLEGRCYERESVPYKAFDSLVDSLCRHLLSLPRHRADALVPRAARQLVQLFPVLEQIDALAQAPQRSALSTEPHELRRRAFEALRELLARLAERQPLVLQIDDLQWGDVDSAHVIDTLMRPPDPPPLLLILSYRSEEAERSRCLRAFTRLLAQWSRSASSAAVIDIELHAFDGDEAEALASALLAEVGMEPRLSARIAKESEGSPFFIHELVRAVGESGGAGESVALEEVLLHRIARLPEDARDLLAAVAVASGPVAHGVVRQALGVGEEQHYTLAHRLQLANLIRSSGMHDEDLVETYHDRIREAVVAGLDDKVLAGLHRGLGTALEMAEQPDLESLADHFQAGGNAAKASMYAERAADFAAASLAFEGAVELYRRALDSAERGSSARRELQIKLGDALANAGRAAEAAELYLDAARDQSDDTALALRQRAATSLLCSGRIESGMTLFRAFLADRGLAYPTSSLAAFRSLLWRRSQVRLRGLRFVERPADEVEPELLHRIDAAWSAVTALTGWDSVRAGIFQSLNLLLSLQAGEPERLVCAIGMEMALMAMLGAKPESRRARALEAVMTDLIERHDRPLFVNAGHVARGATAFYQGRWRACRDECQQAVEITGPDWRGSVWYRTNARILGITASWYMGDVRAISRMLPDAVRDSRERGDLYTEILLHNLAGHSPGLVEDEPERAAATLEAVNGQWPQRQADVQHIARLYAAASICFYLGDAEGAYREIQAVWSRIARSLLLRVHIYCIGMCCLRARAALAVALKDPSQGPGLLRTVRRDERRIARLDSPWGNAWAAFLRSGLARARGNRDVELAELRRAEADFGSTDMLLCQAGITRRIGELLGGDQGREHIARADAYMAGESIVDSLRFTDMLLMPLPE